MEEKGYGISLAEKRHLWLRRHDIGVLRFLCLSPIATLFVPSKYLTWAAVLFDCAVAPTFQVENNDQWYKDYAFRKSEKGPPLGGPSYFWSGFNFQKMLSQEIQSSWSEFNGLFRIVDTIFGSELNRSEERRVGKEC